MCARVCQHKYPNGSITKYGSSGAGSVFSNISFILFSPWCTGRLKLQITPTSLQRCPSVFHSGRPIQSSQGTRLRLTIPFHDPKFCFHWVDVLPVLNALSFFDFFLFFSLCPCSHFDPYLCSYLFCHCRIVTHACHAVHLHFMLHPLLLRHSLHAIPTQR